ncbi:SCO7613 C-terminal domain-containing membrane protein [Streptomyces sp. NPDC002643]
MTHFPSPAEELRLLDTELRHLDARRTFLLARRAWLVNALHTRTPAHTPAPGGPPARRPEASAPGVQNVLLALGGLLLTVAAIAFTLVSWGHMGIAGRAMVLGAVTLTALAAPVALLRHRLRSTAEAVAALGLALTALDAYALHEVAFTDTQGTAYSATASAVLAVTWAAYGLALGAWAPRTPTDENGRTTTAKAESHQPSGRAKHWPAAVRTPLLLPLPLALTAAQLPLLLWSFAANASLDTFTAVLLVTAAADTAIALRVRLEPVRIVAMVGAFGAGAWGVLAAGWLSWAATGPSDAVRASALLALAAAIALTTAWQAPGQLLSRGTSLSLGTALTAGLLSVAALGGTARSVLPTEWTIPAHLLGGVALLTVVRVRVPDPVRRGLLHASVAVQAIALATTVPTVLFTLLGPVGQVTRAWSGAPADARAAATPDLPWPPDAQTVPLVLAVVAVVMALTARSEPWRTQARIGALICAWASLLTLAPVFELPYAAGLAAQGALIVAALVLADRTRPTPPQQLKQAPLPLTATLLALATSVSLAFLSLASEPATLTVLATTTALFGLAAWRTHPGPLTAPASLAHATALTCAIGASAGWAPHHTALLVLTIPTIAALLAARLPHSPVTIPIEATGAAAGLLAIALAATDPPLLSLTLALCGVITAGTAVRPNRRDLGYAAAALFVLASWVRLTSWNVTDPEAYTLPITIPALAVGYLRRRRDPAASSWTAYGPGLAATFGPSLLAAWGDEHWLRPLLLGLAALAVTLLGAHHRLQSPLLLGAATSATVTLHELAPYIAQAVDTLPRWVPPALAGLALLALGATYEQRMRDARRLKESLGRLK